MKEIIMRLCCVIAVALSITSIMHGSTGPSLILDVLIIILGSLTFIGTWSEN